MDLKSQLINERVFFFFIIFPLFIILATLYARGAGVNPPGSSFFNLWLSILLTPFSAFNFLVRKVIPENITFLRTSLTIFFGILSVYMVSVVFSYVFERLRKNWKNIWVKSAVFLFLILNIAWVGINLPSEIRYQRRGPTPTARIISNISHLRSLAEMTYEDKGYILLCDRENTLNENQPEFGNELEEIENDCMEKSLDGKTKPRCVSNEKEYCVSMKIEREEGQWIYYCVDSSGNAGKTKKPCSMEDYKCGDRIK